MAAHAHAKTKYQEQTDKALSKMAASKLLQTALNELAATSELGELRRNWEAIQDPSKRKGEACSQRHTYKYTENISLVESVVEYGSGRESATPQPFVAGTT